MARNILAVFAALTLPLGASTDVRALTWVNETDMPAEADFANLQTPTTLNLQTSQSTELIYGQLFESGLTVIPGAPANVLADVGYGPAGSDPRTSPNWSWFAANYNVQIGGADEFFFALTAPATAGTYSYTFRYSLDNGASYTAADVDGAGSNSELSFGVANLGMMTVAAPPSHEIDFGNLQLPATLNLQASTFTGSIYGRVHETGITESPFDSGVVTASLGFGPAGTDPRTSPQWTWTVANYSAQVGSDDQYQVGFTTPAVNGTYNYTYRYSLDNGTTWTIGDLDGNGASLGLSFDLNQLGVLTVTGGANPVFNPADFDKDHDVDGADLTKWRTAVGPGNAADSDGDGDTDGADFLHWQREFGAASNAAVSGVVPEPTSGAILGTGALAVFAGTSRRRPRR